MISLMLALMATDPGQAATAKPQAAPQASVQAQTQAAAPGVQAAQDPSKPLEARLQECTQESGRLVCRYAVPDFEIVPITVEPLPASGAGVAAVAAVAADPGVLSEAEKSLVNRCADTGWMSLCLPGDRRRARELKAKADAYETTRLEVTKLLGEERCDEAVRTALTGGHLALARQAREFCAPVTARPTPSSF